MEAFTDIFYLSLLQAKVPTCYKKTTIIPILKKAHAVCLSNYCPVALTSIIMKCFERLVMTHILSSSPPRSPRICQPILLLIGNSSLFDKIILSRLISKLCDLGLSSIPCNWTLSFLTHRMQSVRIDATVKKAQQRLFFLRQLRKFGMSIRSLTKFYTIESILSGCITAWYGNCSAEDCKKLQKMVCTAQTITEANLPSADSIYKAWSVESQQHHQRPTPPHISSSLPTCLNPVQFANGYNVDAKGHENPPSFPWEKNFPSLLVSLQGNLWRNTADFFLVSDMAWVVGNDEQGL
eukprot:g38222.t1